MPLGYELHVSPQVFARIRCDGDEGLPDTLAAWARQYSPKPEIPVTIDYDATPEAWRLLDAAGDVVLDDRTPANDDAVSLPGMDIP